METQELTWLESSILNFSEYGTFEDEAEKAWESGDG